MRQPEWPVPSHGHQHSPAWWTVQHSTQWVPDTRPPSDGVGHNWVQISNDTINALKRNAVQRPLHYSQGALGVPFDGYPVHRVGDKWYVEITPSNSRYIQDALRIQEVMGPGTWRYDDSTDRIHIWDGREWLTIDGEVLARLGMQQIMSDPKVSPINPEALRKIKAFLTERDEENERLALRQLLAESQQGDDEE